MERRLPMVACLLVPALAGLSVPVLADAPAAAGDPPGHEAPSAESAGPGAATRSPAPASSPPAAASSSTAPAPAPTAAEIDALIAALDSDQYEARRQAAARLEALMGRPALGARLADRFQRALLRPDLSFEVRSRLE
jgi:hypothetical protein